MKKIFYLSCIVMFAVLAPLFLKNFAPPDHIPEEAKIERFNKTALGCDEIFNNISIIPEYKLRKNYRAKMSFESSRFSPKKYLESHTEDIAVSSHLGDGKVLVTILTNNLSLESCQHIASR